MERGLDFKEVLNSIIKTLNDVGYNHGDLSDIGNELGYALGKLIEDMNDEDMQTFITGFKHGVSLTNGTHF